MSTDVLDVVSTRASIERARGRLSGRFASSVSTVSGTVLGDGLALVDGLPVQAAVSGEQAGRSLALQNVGRPAAAYYVPYGGEGAASAFSGAAGNGASVSSSGLGVVLPSSRLAVNDGLVIETVWPLIGGGALTHAVRLEIDRAALAQRVINENHSDECDGVLDVFQTEFLFRVGTVQVWLNGLLQVRGLDFFEVEGGFEMVLPPWVGDDLLVAYEVGV